jgi:hypothetical protein
VGAPSSDGDSNLLLLLPWEDPEETDSLAMSKATNDRVHALLVELASWVLENSKFHREHLVV